MSLSFGEKIKEARKQKNLTQKQLADLIGAAHNSISDWENNKNKPDPDTIELLCGVLKITPNYLLKSSEDDFSPFEKLLVKRYRNLDASGKKHIDYELDREIERVDQIHKQSKRIESLEAELLQEHKYLFPNAAHERTDIEVTDEMRQHDDNIMDDKDF